MGVRDTAAIVGQRQGADQTEREASEMGSRILIISEGERKRDGKWQVDREGA